MHYDKEQKSFLYDKKELCTTNKKSNDEKYHAKKHCILVWLFLNGMLTYQF